MNNVEEKAIIDISNSYETISLEPNVDEAADKLANSSNTNTDNKYSAYPSLPLSSSSEGNASMTNEDSSSSKITQIYQTMLLKANTLIEKIQIEKSYKMFFAVMAVGLVFLFLSLLMLPMFLLTPIKFIFTFGTGSILIVSSFVFLYGMKEYCQMLFEQNRKWLTISFLISIIVGVIFAWRGHFFLSLIFAVYQMIAVIMFTLSFVPGGQNGIYFIKDLLQSPLINIYESIKTKFHLSSQSSQ